MDQRQIMGHRIRAQQLDRREGGTLADTHILDLGVQNTGPDGALLALENRGLRTRDLDPSDLILLWTLRGAPHFYRRTDASHILAATYPLSEPDAAKKVFDASKPLREAGIPILDALDTIADALRDIVTEPMTKGAASALLTQALSEPYRRKCNPCKTIHLYEQTFRHGTTRAAIELRPGTSPPVLQPIPGIERATGRPDPSAVPQFDPIRRYLYLLGPATHKQVAEFVDSPLKEVKAHWPADAVEVDTPTGPAWLLPDDAGPAPSPPTPSPVHQARRTVTATNGPALLGQARLLGPFDLFLQARDRSNLVADPERAKKLWPVLGRPGAILGGDESAGSDAVLGLWRPRAAGRKLTVHVEPWTEWSPTTRQAVEAEAERLAERRDAQLEAVVDIT